MSVAETVQEKIGAWGEELDEDTYADRYMSIPGKGDPGPGCGEWGIREFCDTCGEIHAGPHKCHRRQCPDCWTAWVGKRAEAIVSRIQAARWAEPDGLDRRTVHAVASPPEGEVKTIGDVRRYRQKARERLKEKGVRGDVCVFHGFRATEETKEAFEDLEDFEGGIWHWIRENDREWKEQVYWSPHYHFIGLCREFGADESDSDWVIRRLSSPDPFQKLTDVDAYRSLAKIAVYLLSHATYEINESVDSVTWGGALHPSQFQAEEEISEGSLKVIRRLSAEACRKVPQLADTGVEEVVKKECDESGCQGRLKPIFDAPRHLQSKRWCNRIGREKERRLSLAFDWAIGEVVPPPGMKNPRSEGDVWEAFEELYEQRHSGY